MDMTIGTLAQAAGVGVETIRFYQRRGLMALPVRGGAGGTVRRYGEPDLARLRFIRSAQAAGFALDEVGKLLALDAGQDREQARAMARARIEALDARIGALQAARASLERLADACGRATPGPCPILAAFESGQRLECTPV